MSKAEFQLAYDGPALRGGAMDVNELASSLLAVGELVQSTNRELNGERASVMVRVRSDFKKGSFEIALLLDYALIEHIRTFLPGAMAAAITGAAIIKLLFGSETAAKGAIGAVGSVLDLWKKLKGEKPKETIEDRANGLIIIVTGDGNQITVNPSAAALYDKESIRNSIGGVVRPLTKDGITSLEIRKGAKAINRVRKEDMPPVTSPSGSSSNEYSQNVRSDSRPAVLRVARANFEKGKWGFSDGAASFSAEILDAEFKKRLDAREIGFFKGDTLSVILTVTQTVSEDGDPVQTKYVIDQVIEHKHAAVQIGLPVTSEPKSLLPAPEERGNLRPKAGPGSKFERF